jgi:hypothetical protein
MQLPNVTSKELIDLLIKMFKADDKIGCGFYSNDEWKKAYDELRKIINYENSHD